MARDEESLYEDGTHGDRMIASAEALADSLRGTNRRGGTSSEQRTHQEWYIGPSLKKQ